MGRQEDTHEESASVKGESTPESPRRRSGGTLTFMKEAINAVREAGDDKIEFVKDRLEAEARERDKRSEALYEISQQRADDMQKAMQSKDRTIKGLWFLIIMLIAAVVVLAGHAVGLHIPGIGKVEMGDKAKVEATEEE